MRKLEVVAALIMHDSKFLIAKRHADGPLGDKWEFPGGKIEPNETQEEALKREINEELGLKISGLRHFMTTHHAYETFYITLIAYTCQAIHRDVILHEHQDVAWVTPHDMLKFDFAPADLPIVQALITKGGHHA